LDETSVDGDITRRSTILQQSLRLAYFKAVPSGNLRAKAQDRAT